MLAGLQQEKKQWLERLRAAEAEAERCRAEAQQLRLQRLQLLPGGGGDLALAGALSRSGQPAAELVEQLLEAQAAEAALRSVLGEAREQQVAAAKALASELRRVHALERLRISDMAEVQRMQQRAHDLQVQVHQLGKALAAAQQQLSSKRGRGRAGGDRGGGEFHIAAFAGKCYE